MAEMWQRSAVRSWGGRKLTCRQRAWILTLISFSWAHCLFSMITSYYKPWPFRDWQRELDWQVECPQRQAQPVFTDAYAVGCLEFSFIYRLIRDKVSHFSGWPWIYYVAKDAFELLIVLLHSLSAGITNVQHCNSAPLCFLYAGQTLHHELYS